MELTTNQNTPRPARVPVVGLGASAGGVESFSRLFAALPPSLGLAFVVVQHLDPGHPSALDEVLARTTSMPVVVASDGTTVEADHVYVIPPNADLTLSDGVLHVGPRGEQARGPHLSIDLFFRSLAAAGEHAIGVLLSGTGSDGTEGLHAIRDAGGIALAESGATARFAAMPEHAAEARAVDALLPIEELAGEIARLAEHVGYADQTPTDQAMVRELVELVRRETGVDFGDYKTSTLHRRIARRVALRHAHDLAAYLGIARSDAAEVRLLAEDVLIHVTKFFRDPEVFEALAARFLPDLLSRKGEGEPVRVWVAGCSTGEEAYSLAILLLEATGGRPKMPIQIFGSDVSADAIERARSGLFPEAALRDVSPERIQRFFAPIAGGYRVQKAVRDLCVFVKHDVTRDPPFVRLDLVSCRNVLIYFGAALQKRVLPLLHYSLNPGALLVLGRTESPAAAAELFSPVDAANKIFTRVGVASAVDVARLAARPAQQAARGYRNTLGATQTVADAQRQADRLLLDRFAPCGVVVDDRYQVVQFRGRTGRYLEPAPGEPDLNLLRMARDGLVFELRAALDAALAADAPVRREAMMMPIEEGVAHVTIEVVPLPRAPDETRFLLVLFSASGSDRAVASAATRPAARADSDGEPNHVDTLREEMTATKNYLQSLLDERQRGNDELGSMNEELTSTNEELQSANEELETAKEELQSTNEELTTVNDELHVVNSDLENLVRSVEIPILILDSRRRIRRFTPRARAVWNVIPGDVGRPISEIRARVEVHDLDARIASVLEALDVHEHEVSDREGHWWRLQIRPYRTLDNRIDGVVLSLVDIDALKRAAARAEEARAWAETLVETVPVPLVVLDGDRKVVSVNPAFCQTFDDVEASAIDRPLFRRAPGEWDVGPAEDEIAGLLTGEGTRFATELEVVAGRRGRRRVALAASRVKTASGASWVLLSLDDVTERRKLEAERSLLLSTAERANRAKDLFLATLSHELRTPLTSILMQAEALARDPSAPASARQTGARVERAARAQAVIIDDLLDLARIEAGKLELAMLPVDLARIASAALDTVEPVARAKGVTLARDLATTPIIVLGDATRLQQVAWNLLNNALKFTPAGGRVALTLGADEQRAALSVADTGQGISAELLPHVFEAFRQADSSATRRHGGLGLGLAIVTEIVRLHGGTVRAESAGPGSGATLTVLLPVVATDATAMAGEAPGGAESPGARLDGARVLVVEDDAETREAVASMLRAGGADVRLAASADEAMARFAEGVPDVLLSDVAMPDESGLDLIARVRALGPDHGGNVPAMAFTALAGPEDRQRALDAGFAMHLAKPCAGSVLCDAVAKLRTSAPPSGR